MEALKQRNVKRYQMKIKGCEVLERESFVVTFSL
jgi:hypothetical protein